KRQVLAQRETELRGLRHEAASEAEQLERRRDNANETLSHVCGPQIADTITAINDQENELLYGRGTYEPKQQSDYVAGLREARALIKALPFQNINIPAAIKKILKDCKIQLSKQQPLRDEVE